MTKASAVSFEQYLAASDRIMRGHARLGDAAICRAYTLGRVR